MSPRDILESFLRIVPSSPAWPFIGSLAPVREMEGLVSEHQAEVTCEEGQFTVTWRLDETMDRLAVLIVVTEPLVEDAAFAVLPLPT